MPGTAPCCPWHPAKPRRAASRADLQDAELLYRKPRLAGSPERFAEQSQIRPISAVSEAHVSYERGEWCPGADSNHRHADFQSAALPTELPGLPENRTRGAPPFPARRRLIGNRREVSRSFDAAFARLDDRPRPRADRRLPSAVVRGWHRRPRRTSSAVLVARHPPPPEWRRRRRASG